MTSFEFGYFDDEGKGVEPSREDGTLGPGASGFGTVFQNRVPPA
jgi:hypothetical protein